jgi:hypothetical protein
MKDKILVSKILTDLETRQMPFVDIRRQARRLRELIFGAPRAPKEQHDDER